jgi:hypothetical protein
MTKTIVFAAATLALLGFSADTEATAKPRLMIKPHVNLNSSHQPSIRIIRLKLRSQAPSSSIVTSFAPRMAR